MRGHLTDDADAEPWSGERVPPDHFLGKPELGPHAPHLVFEERTQRLNQGELEVVGQTADIVMRLDVGRAGAPTGFDDVGIERALNEEFNIVFGIDLSSGLLETR